MEYQYSPYILPLLIATLISFWVAFYSWQHRSKHGAASLAFLALAITGWLIGYTLEISAVGLAGKVFWGQTQYIGIAFIPLLWLVFSYNHSNQGKKFSQRSLILLMIVPLITVVLSFTTRMHGLIWQEVHVNQSGDFSSLGVTYGIWFWVHSVYSYGLLLVGAFIIIRSLIRNKGLYRSQGIALLVAVLAPWVGNALYLSGLSPVPHLDPTPFAFTLTLIAVLLGIFGFRLIDLSPVARDILVEEMSDGMLVLDERGFVADANPAVQRIIGKSSALIIGQPVSDVLAQWPQLLEQFAGVLDGSGEIAIGEGESRQWYELHLSPLYDKQKRFIGRVITAHNVNDRKQAEEQKQSFLNDMKALQELHLELSQVDDLETLYAKMIQLSQERLGLDRVGLFLLDAVNNQIVGTFGVDSDGKIRDERNYRGAISPDHWILNVLNSPGHAKFWENSPLLDNGAVVGTGWRAAAILWNGHEAIGYLFCDNLSTHRNARPYEAELISILGSTFGHLIERMQANERLSQLSRAVEASPTSIVITDTTGAIQYVNPKFTQVTGYTFEEALSQNPRILKTDKTPREVYQQLWVTLAAGKEWRGEFCNRKKSGELYWELASISPIIDSSGKTTHYVAVKEDITARKDAEVALALARDQAMEASRLKSQLLAKVSHELRTPLGGILGYAELMYLETFGPLSEKQKDATSQIIESTRYLTAMVNDLLDEAQIEARSVSLRLEKFSPSEMLEKIQTSMEVMAREKGLAFSATITSGFPDTLYGDKHRLQQILVNLVGNAIKFTKAGGIGVKLSLPDPQHWSMQVSDTGIGIPLHAQAYVFEPFRQVDNAITRENRGTGLGLSIVKQLVELMDGQILLESEAGQGSTFSVILPILKS